MARLEPALDSPNANLLFYLQNQRGLPLVGPNPAGALHY